MRHGAARPRPARGRFAGLIARVGVFLAAVALVSQMLAGSAQMTERPQGAGAAAVELTALLGPGVVICTQADDSGTPPNAPDCHDNCPLCRLAANAAALDAPAGVELGAPAPPALISRLEPGRRPAPATSLFPRSPLPRGPPSPT